MKIKCLVVSHFNFDEDITEIPIKREQIIATKANWNRLVNGKVFPELTIWYEEE